MTQNVSFSGSIDPNVDARYLAETWVCGNHSHVIDILKRDHAGLTALLLVQFGPCGEEGHLSESDCNAIANRLIDDRVNLVQSSD